MNTEYVLEMKNISKQYGENAVLQGVSLSVKKGEIHALLGENGAGKSTLMNVLFGMPVIHSTGGFEGSVYLNGEETRILSPHDAMEKGIGMVHQEFMLLPGFTITENIKLNREICRPNPVSRVLGKNLEGLDMKAMQTDARTALDHVGMSIDENTLVQGLPVGYMQFVEIAREIDKTGVKLLVFDEPTAVLTESEAAQLISVMKKIAESGIAIIFITHRLDEVMAASNNITILRDGKLVATRETKNTSIREIAELMVGRKGESMAEVEPRPVPQGKVAMSIKDLYVNMPGERVNGLSLDVIEGEILGIGGLAGQGKLGISNGIMGLYEVEGEVTLFGEKLNLMDTREVLKAGVAMVSEDRKGVGLLLDRSIEDNIVFNSMQIKDEYLKKIGPFTLVDSRKVRQTAEEYIKSLDIRCFGPTQHSGTLSGGNQQKILIAKCLEASPQVLIVDEPTRGVDVSARNDIYQLLRSIAAQNVAVLLISSDLEEIELMADRVYVMHQGEIAHSALTGRDINVETIMRVAFGDSQRQEASC